MAEPWAYSTEPLEAWPGWVVSYMVMTDRGWLITTFSEFTISSDRPTNDCHTYIKLGWHGIQLAIIDLN